MIQINLNSKWFSVVKYFVFAIMFHLILGWFGRCSLESKKDNAQKVTVPAVVGKFESKKTQQTPLKWPEKDQLKPIIKWNKQLIPFENPINMELANKYVMASDSIEKLNLYIKSIQLNKFSTKFEDDNLLLNINGIVQGEIQEITPDYIIKSHKIEVPLKQTVFRLSLGGEIGTNITSPELIFKGNVILQNGKGNSFSGSFDTNNTIWVGYSRSIFNIKR